ncbi:CGNR zinc finger domain-containing protein [Brevibacillus reuszeri]|uniref:CGNR zinc finger domain-containing protein n=1 Tax=Brevibacillus reuszeri TaxID=54915 RepID=UPI001FD286E9|nr:ABATE domain-containing protein [Brevibacillus reuszeri]
MNGNATNGGAVVEWLCIDFLNSDWRDWRGSGKRENRLDKQEWLEAFFHQWKLTAPAPPDEQVRLSLLRLREQLRRIVEAVVSGEAASQEDVDALNHALALVPSSMRVADDKEGQGYRLEQISTAEGWALIQGRIAESFAQLLTSQDVRRIKICHNDDCKWVFFDESRNRVRRWCDDKMCGNLMKVRRFRERQKEKG